MSLKERYQKSILDNGLRVVTETMPSARSISIGFWVDVGSRDEQKEENGISHFIEHMMFKGTKRRSPKIIASSLESLGGMLNAFTSREHTCFHATVLDEHLPQAVDVLTDIMMNSTFSHANLKKEKLVVIEEIVEVDETPSDLIHELFSTCFWRGHPLGFPIMGNARTIRALNRGDVLRYIARHYRAGRMVVAAAGNVSHRTLISLLKKRFYFPPGEEGRGEVPPPIDDFFMKLYRKKSTQTHFCLGFPGIRFSDPERNAVLALHTYLGGGMASVLFQKIREDRGMAYSVYTFLDFYRDSGVFGAYLATDRRRLNKALGIILREFGRVKRDRIPSLKLNQIKTQLKGSLALSMESTTVRMNRLGRHELLSRKHFSLDETLKAVDRIRADDLVEAARVLFLPEKLTVTSLGPAGEKDLNKIDWSRI